MFINNTKGNRTLGNCMDNITLGNLTLGKYTLVTFTLGNLALNLGNHTPGTHVISVCSAYKFTPLQNILP